MIKRADRSLVRHGTLGADRRQATLFLANEGQQLANGTATARAASGPRHDEAAPA